MPKKNIKKLTLNYLKTGSYRSIHSDGAIGGITPAGNIHISFYNERLPIPKKAVHSISEDGQLGEIIEQEKLDGVVREMEVDVVMSVNSARNLYDWLGKRLTEIDKLVTVKGEK